MKPCSTKATWKKITGREVPHRRHHLPTHRVARAAAEVLVVVAPARIGEYFDLIYRFTQLVKSTEDVIPSGQGVHEADPVLLVNVPISHVLQDEAPVELYEPGWHSVQVIAPL